MDPAYGQVAISKIDIYKEDVRQLVHAQLDKLDLPKELEEMLSGVSTETDLTDDILFNKLRELGVVDTVMNNVGLYLKELENLKPNKISQHLIEASSQRAVSDTYLELTLSKGRAFLEHLPTDDNLPGSPLPTFKIHISFQGQRLQSLDIACTCEPDIHQQFTFKLSAPIKSVFTRLQRGLPDFLNVRDNISIILVRHEIDGRNSLLGTGELSWRQVLCEKDLSKNGCVKILGIGSESQIPVGLIDYCVKFHTWAGQQQQLQDDPITLELLTAQETIEYNRDCEQSRLFFIYTKQWWSEYVQLRAAHKQRKITLFATCESGESKFVCSFVSPLNAGRLIETPRQALRFVSLFPKRVEATSPHNNADVWYSRSAMLACAIAKDIDRSVLLCSLLLGYGLTAYVCVGTKKYNDSTATWVVTLEDNGPTLFWDASSGEKHIHSMQKISDAFNGNIHHPNHPFLTITCLFNQANFYANIQEKEVVITCNFQVKNTSLWKMLSADAIEAVTTNPGWSRASLPLLPPAINTADASDKLERELKTLLIQYRLERDLRTHFDNKLAYILSPALVSYELERELGCAVSNEEFQQAIRCRVPPGHTFKGYPIQFNSADSSKVMKHSLKFDLCRDIMSCRGDKVQIAVRAKITLYPDCIQAVWVMWACHYTSIT